MGGGVEVLPWTLALVAWMLLANEETGLCEEAGEEAAGGSEKDREVIDR